MKMIKEFMATLLIVLIIISIILCCCPTVQEITKIYPLKEYVIINGGIDAVFTIKGTDVMYFFDESSIYSTEESSRIIALWYEDWESTDLQSVNEIYLYLNEEEYTAYIKEKYNIE